MSEEALTDTAASATVEKPSSIMTSTEAGTPAGKPTSTSNELRLVFVGKTGSGKSSTASTIAGKKDVFKASGRGKSQTVSCQCEKVEVLGQKLLLVDTPGIYDTSQSLKEIEGKIGVFIKMTAPGPHAILFVTSAANRFTDEEVGVIKKLEELFGEAIEEYLIIVVTRTEDWEDEGMEPPSFLNDLPEEAKQVLGTCISENRAIAFKNKFNKDNGKPHDETQVKKLLRMIVKTVGKNGNKCYTEGHWKKAEEEMKKREQEILEQEMKAEQERIDKIKRAQLDKLQEQYKAQIKKMQAVQDKERKEREAREKEAQKKRKHELKLEMEKMRLEAEEKMQKLKAEERARAQEEQRKNDKQMEETRLLELQLAKAKAAEALRQQEEKLRAEMEMELKKAEAKLREEMEKEKQRLGEEARDRARKELEKKSCVIL